MNNRRSPIKQQRTKNSNAIPIPNVNRMRPTSSIGLSYTKTNNSHHRHYSHTTSPTAMSASLLPAVPLFYSNTYADPPECSSLPKPPESWYLSSSLDNENVSIAIETKTQIEVAKEFPEQKSNRKSSSKKNHYKSFHTTRAHEKFPPSYVSVRA